VPPLLDYPDWLLQGTLFARMVRGEPTPGYHLQLLPVPNAASTVLIGGLSLFVDSEVAGKLVLSLALLAVSAGGAYFLGRWPLAVVAAIYAPSSAFFHGNLSYVLGLGALLAACGYVVRGGASAPMLAGTAVLLYGCHATVFGVWALVLTIYRPRRVWTLMPAGALLVWYALDRMASGRVTVGSGVGWREVVIGKLGSLASYGAPFQGFTGFADPADPQQVVGGALNLATLLALAAAGVGCLLLARSAADRRPLAIAGALGVGFVLLPLSFAGIVSPGERLLYPALFFGLLFLAPWLGCRAFGAAIVGLWAVQAIYMLGHGGRVAGELDRTLLALRPTGPEFAIVHEAPTQPKPLYLPLHPVLMKLPYYLHLEQRSYVALFDTGLIVSEWAEARPEASPAAIVVGRTAAARLGPAFVIEVDAGRALLLRRR